MSLKMRYKKLILISATTLFALAFSGCTSSGEGIAKAMNLIQTMDYQGALDELDIAEENGENIRLIQRARGIAYMGLTQYQPAISSFEASIAWSNGFPEDMDFDLNFYLAAAYTKNGQYSEAESIYNAILALRPEEEEVYFLRGNVRMALGDISGAKEDFDRAVEYAPENYDRLVEIYEVLAFFGCEEDGKGYLRAVLNNAEKDMDDHIVGKIYYYLGEYQNAYLTLEEAKQDGNIESYLYLGKAYEATGDYNYAVNVYNSYLSKYEGNAQLYNQLGLCELSRGEYQNALEAFQAGMQLENVNIMQTLSFNEIVAYEYLGEFDRAYVLLENYLKNYPDDAVAKREYDFLSTR